MDTKFSTDISTQLKTIATDEDLAQLRRVVNEVEQGPNQQPWRLSLLAWLIDAVQRRVSADRRRD